MANDEYDVGHEVAVLGICADCCVVSSFSKVPQ